MLLFSEILSIYLKPLLKILSSLIFLLFFFFTESCSDEDKETVNSKKVEVNFSGDDENSNFLLYAPTQLVSEKIKAIRLGKEKYDPQEDNEEIFGDSYTVGSTSKSSSEWRSSIHCRDSGTEDPFSSSSRRSCPKWESYTVFQKYDEEMMFLDRVSAQKLHETGLFMIIFSVIMLTG